MLIPAGDPFITLSAASGGEQAQSITFNESYTLSSGTLSIASGGVTVASGKIASIGTIIQGLGGVVMGGPGTLQLTGVNTYSGGVQVGGGGTMVVQADSAMGNAGNVVTISNDSILRADASFSTARTFAFFSSGGKFEVGGTNTLTLNGTLGSGASGVTKLGAGTLVLNAASTRTGTTSIQGGTLRLGNGTAIGSGAVSFSGGGVLELSGVNRSDPMTLPASTSGSLRGRLSSTYSGTITAAGGVSLLVASGTSSTDVLIIGDYDGGAGSTTHVSGSGEVILSGSGNSYSGAWAVDSGTLRLQHANSITSSASPIVINSGGTVIAEATSTYTGGWTIGGLLRVLNSGGAGSGPSGLNVNSGGTMQVEGVNLLHPTNLNAGGTIKGIGSAAMNDAVTAAASVSNLTLASGATVTDTLTVNNYTGGSGSTTHVTGSGEVILPSASTYAGGWAIDSGTLRADHALATGTNSSSIAVNSGGTLHLRGVNFTRNITMNNGSRLLGSVNPSSPQVQGTLSIASGAAVTFDTTGNPEGLVIGDSANDLTGGGGGSTITIASGSALTLGSSSNYVGNWIVQGLVDCNSDNKLGNAANTVTLNSGALVSFSAVTFARQFFLAGNSALQVFNGNTMTLNGPLNGTFGTFTFSGNGTFVLNSGGSMSGTLAEIATTVKVNDGLSLGTAPVSVINGATMELGTNVLLTQPATLHNGAVLRGGTNSKYFGTITVDTVGGDDVTLSTITNTDVLTIGNGTNDLTGGGAGSVITAAGPGRVLLAQPSNVTADWMITGGVLEIGAANRLGNASSVTINGFAALQLSNCGVTNINLTLQNGALWANGVSSYSESGSPKIANAAPIAAITVLGASDVLTIGSAIRNVSAGVSSTNIAVNGPGRLVLSSGGTTATDIFSGSWTQSSGILQVGQTAGNSINGLGFKNGDAKQANSIRVNGGTLAVGVVGSGANTPDWLRANVTLNGGAIALTNIINGRFGGDLVLEASSTSRVLVFDPVSPTIETDVHLAGGAAGPDNNAAVTEWRFNSQLIVDPGSNNGGQFTIQRDGGTISVDGSVCALIINEGAQVDLGGTADALSDGVDHVNVINDGSFFITQGSKNIGSLSGTGNTFTLPGTSLTVHQHVSAPSGLIGNSGSFVKEGAGTLSVLGIGGGAITINGGAVNSTVGVSTDSGESITLSGGNMTAPSLINNGTVTVSTGSTLTTDLLTAGNDGTLTGGSGTGSITMTGGTVSAKKVLLGSSAGGSGSFVMSGGTLLTEALAANDFIVNGFAVTVTQPAVPDDPVMDGSIVAGYVHDGTVIFNGGFITVPKIKLGVTAGKTGSFTLNGAVVTIGTLGVGNDGTAGGGAGTGVAVFNGGALDLTNLIIGSTSGGVGEATLGLSESTGVLEVSTLSINSAAGNKLDLTDGKLIVTAGSVGSWNGSEYTGVTGLLQRGRNEFAWDGSGIVTSMSDATTSVLTTLAVSLAEDAFYDGGTFGGVSVNAGDVLVMYTWGGDANLDGTLNGDDYFRIDSNILLSGSVFGYANGDFNYDGELNGEDYFIIDSNIIFAQNSQPFPTGAVVSGLTAIPEPAAGMGLLAGLAGIRRIRRRK